MCAVCDVNATGGYLNVEAIGTFWDLRKRCEVTYADFVGYWEQGCPVRATTTKALASVYKSKSIVAIPVANRLPNDTMITVRVDLEALGLPDRSVRLKDERSGKRLVLADGSFTVPVKARNYTFVSLRAGR